MTLPAMYVPAFRVRINGDDLPAAVRGSVTGIRFEDGTPSYIMSHDQTRSPADRVEITLANTDLRWLQRHIRGLGFQPFPTGIRIGPVRVADAAPDGTFDVDNTVRLSLGYADGQMADVFLGEITGVEADFPASGMPTLTIVAHDYLHRLSEGSYARGFGPLPDWLIAAILSAENLLLPAIDPVVGALSTTTAVLNAIFTGTGRKQKGQSDLALLKEIADTYDADFWVDGNVLYLSRILGKSYTPSVTLTWGRSLLSYAPRVHTVGQVAGVAIKFTLPLIPLDFIVAVSWDFDRESLNVVIVPGAAAAALKNIAGAVQTIINRNLNTPADVAQAALYITRMLRNKLNSRLTGSGTAVGDPRIRAGAIVRLDGMGPDFSGDYRVTSATHTIDQGGYRTAFTVQKEIIP